MGNRLEIGKFKNRMFFVWHCSEQRGSREETRFGGGGRAHNRHNHTYLSCHYDMPLPTWFGGAFLCPQPSLNNKHTNTEHKSTCTNNTEAAPRAQLYADANLHHTLTPSSFSSSFRAIQPKPTHYLRARRSRKYYLSIISSLSCRLFLVVSRPRNNNNRRSAVANNPNLPCYNRRNVGIGSVNQVPNYPPFARLTAANTVRVRYPTSVFVC